ncbi:TPA: hypothetical protein IAB29_00855 [Candidatus Ventrenecus stercoripullorum]|nr:hypothetical protein [Candidatus Ventrenecus stercoripullorum]
MNRQEKVMPFLLVVILVFLIIEFVYTIYNYIDYEKRKDSGNERWQQVEERIKKIEECCDGRNS